MQLRKYIAEPTLITVMRQAFTQWDEDSLKKLIEMSKHTKRDYGSDIILIQGYKILRKRVEDYSWSGTTTESGKWLKIYSTSSL